MYLCLSAEVDAVSQPGVPGVRKTDRPGMSAAGNRGVLGPNFTVFGLGVCKSKCRG